MARSFDGSADYLVASSGLGLTTYPFSFSLWFRVANLTHAGTLISLSQSTTSTGYYRLLFRGDLAEYVDIQCVAPSGANMITSSSNSVSAADVWHHAAGVFTNATTRHVFLNNVKTAGATTSVLENAGVNRISVGQLVRSGTGNLLNGQVAEVGAWNWALSDAEVEQLSQGYAPISVRPQSCVGYWPMHGRAGASGNEEPWIGSVAMEQVSSPAVTDHPRIIYPRRRSDIWVPPVLGAAPSITALSAISITATSAQPRISYS